MACSSSCSKQSTRMTWACRNGSRGLDHALSPLRLEHGFLGRHKPFHFRVWYRDALAGYLQEMLLDPRALSRPYVERKGLEAVIKGHLKGRSKLHNRTTQATGPGDYPPGLLGKHREKRL